MIKDTEIICQAYEFPESTTDDKRNFFHPSSGKYTVGAPVNLTPYLASINRLSSARSINNTDKNSLQYDFGDLKFSVVGIRDNHFLEDFFLIKDTQNLTFRRLYTIVFKHKNAAKFFGYIDNASIIEAFRRPSAKNNTNIIELSAIALSKQCQTYLSTLDLPAPADVFVNGLATPLPWNYDKRTEDNGTIRCSSMPFYWLISKITGINTGAVNIADWHICNIPQMFKTKTSTSWFVRSGYKRWYEEGLTVYQFLDYLCKSFGWEWELIFFLENPASYAIRIKNRSDFTLPVLYLPFSKRIESAIQNTSAGAVKHIIIPDGQLRGFNYRTGLGQEMGVRFKMISNSAKVNNHTNFFETFSGQAGIGDNCNYSMQSSNLFRSTLKEKEDSERYHYGERWLTAQTWDDYAVERFSVLLNETLIVDAGTQTKMRTVVDPPTTKNYPALDYGESLWDIVYSGNVGACCVVRAMDNSNFITDYHEYCKTDQFKNNYAPLLGGGSGKTIPYETAGIYTDPNVKVKFTETDDPFYRDGEFALNSLDTDYENNVSKFTLTRK